MPQDTAEPPVPAGSIPALVTPMHDDGTLDWDSYRSLIDWHVDAGTDAIVVMGSTGESAAVSMEEHRELISVAVNYALGRIPIIAGIGANSTSEAVELTQFAKDAGATAALSVVPYTTPRTRFDDSITKALARAHRWRSLIEDGTYASITELAKDKGVNDSYACRLLRLTLLAPDIIEAILDRRGTHLTLDPLMQPLPFEWDKQRSVLQGSG